MRQTILFGNGINLLLGKEYSWDNVLAKLTTDNSGVLKSIIVDGGQQEKRNVVKGLEHS